MTMNPRLEKAAIAMALGLPCAASLILMFIAPGAVSASTYAVVVALLIGSTGIGVQTWKSAQATSSVAQLLYETNTNTEAIYSPSARRVAILVGLSAVTTAVVVATWLL